MKTVIDLVQNLFLMIIKPHKNFRGKKKRNKKIKKKKMSQGHLAINVSIKLSYFFGSIYRKEMDNFLCFVYFVLSFI